MKIRKGNVVYWKDEGYDDHDQPVGNTYFEHRGQLRKVFGWQTLADARSIASAVGAELEMC